MEENNFYSEHLDDIKDLVAQLGDYIAGKPVLAEKNFALYYQHGRIGFVDLDAFAQTTKVALEENGEQKSLADIQNSIDKETEE